MDVAVQTASPCEISQDAATQTSDQPGSSLSLDVAVQTIFRSVCSSSLDAAVQTLSQSSLSQDVSTQFGSRPASSFSVGASMQTSAHSVVQLDAATQLDLTEFLIGWIFSDNPLDRRHPFCQSPPSVLGSHVVPLPPPGLEQSVPSPELPASLQSRTNISSSSCPTQQSPVSTTHVGTHPVRTASSANRRCKYRVRWNAQFYWLHSSHRRRAIPQTKGSDSSYGQFWTSPVQWTRPHCHSR